MANVRTDNRIVVDTAGAADIVGASQILHIMGFAWDTAAAVSGSQVIVTDTAGVNVWSYTTLTSVAVNMLGISFSRPIVSVGLKVPTLTATTKLYVYLYN